MKYFFLKTFSLVVALIYFSTQVGLASEVGPTVEYYKIYLYDGKHRRNVSVKAKSFSQNGDQLIVQLHKKGKNQTYPLGNVKKMEAVGEKIGSNAIKGLIIGAVSTGVISGVYSGIVITNICFDENPCSRGGDNVPGIIFGLAGMGIGAVVGGLVGLGVGAAIPKRQKIKVSPLFFKTSKETQAGAALSVAF